MHNTPQMFFQSSKTFVCIELLKSKDYTLLHSLSHAYTLFSCAVCASIFHDCSRLLSLLLNNIIIFFFSARIVELMLIFSCSLIYSSVQNYKNKIFSYVLVCFHLRFLCLNLSINQYIYIQACSIRIPS